MKLLLIILLSICYVPIQAHKVFVTDWRIAADFAVYVTNEKSKADLIVYKTDQYLEAYQKDEVWKFVGVKTQSERRVYFTANESESDLVVYFTNKISEAKWVNESKKHFLLGKESK